MTTMMFPIANRYWHRALKDPWSARAIHWITGHNHLTSRDFQSLVPWWCPRWIRCQRTRLNSLRPSDAYMRQQPGRRQAIIRTNTGILLIWPLGTNFSEISIDIQTFSFKKIHLKMSSGKWRPFCLGLNVLINVRTRLRDGHEADF